MVFALLQGTNISSSMRLFSPKLVNEIVNKLPTFLDQSSKEALLNVAVSIAVSL